jgi:hypothetical protein
MLAPRPLLPHSGQPTHKGQNVADVETWSTPSQSAVYQIVVRGELTEDWSSWFNDGRRVWSTAIVVDRGMTTVTGTVADQPALYGLLAKVRDLGLPLVSVFQVGDESAGIAP